MLLRQAASPTVATLLTGEISQVESLAEVLAQAGRGAWVDGKLVQVAFAVPFCQIKEKGYKVRDGGEKVLCLRVEAAKSIPLDELLAELEAKHGAQFSLSCPVGQAPQELAGVPCAFDSTEAEYEDVVRDVLLKEIHSGEGSSFVTPRAMTVQIDNFMRSNPLGIFRRLLLDEAGSYWCVAASGSDNRRRCGSFAFVFCARGNIPSYRRLSRSSPPSSIRT